MQYVALSRYVVGDFADAQMHRWSRLVISDVKQLVQTLRSGSCNPRSCVARTIKSNPPPTSRYLDHTTKMDHMLKQVLMFASNANRNLLRV